MTSTLAYHDTSLESLFHTSNNAIFDLNADAVKHMLEPNRSLKTIYIYINVIHQNSQRQSFANIKIKESLV